MCVVDEDRSLWGVRCVETKPSSCGRAAGNYVAGELVCSVGLRGAIPGAAANMFPSIGCLQAASIQAIGRMGGRGVGLGC